MPAAAVIPAPIAYINVVAVKKLVVETLTLAKHQVLTVSILANILFLINLSFSYVASFTVNKLGCSKQTIRLNTLAWNNRIRSWLYRIGNCQDNG